ncbi:MAG: VCBS repeat-containing protein [Planctomycetota bacterium]|nr:VCBS repeat-containing protein [Planctomycetota bacterium]
MKDSLLVCACALSLASFSHSAVAQQFAASDGGLYPQRNYLLAGGLPSLALVDFDRDGLRDLYTGGASFLRGGANGVFGEEVALGTSAPWPLAWIRTGDANGDGTEDILGRAYDGTGGVLAVDPQGGPPQWTSLPATGFVQRALVGRFDLDAHPDVVVIAGLTGQRTANLWLGNGSGGWLSAGTYPMPAGNQLGSEGAVAVDFDHDGLTDLAFTSVNGLALRRRTSNGFVAHQLLPGAGLNGEPVAADFDGDGWEDLVVCVGPNGQLWFARNVLGTFAAPVLLPSPGPIYPANVLYAADFDGDGASELFFGGGGGLWILKLNGTGFTLLDVLDTFRADAIALLDLDGQGKSDLVWMGVPFVRVRMRDALSRFENVESVPCEGPTSVVDIDGDGAQDFVTRMSTGVRVRLRGELPIDSPTVLPLNVRLRVLDLDGVGALDLLCGPWIALADPTHPGRHLPAQKLVSLPDWREATVIDWNSDGRPDLAHFADWDTTTLRIRLGLPGGFDATELLFPLPVSMALSTLNGGDFDGDGAQELIAGDGSTAWWLSPDLGTGSVAQSIAIPNASACVPLRSRTFQRDILFAQHADALRTWLLEHTGLWRELATRPAEPISAVEPFDVDSDGDLDLIWNSYGQIKVLRLGPHGEMLDMHSHGELLTNSQVSVADLDHDGRPDLCLGMKSAIGPEHRLNILEQQSDLPGRYCVGAGAVAGCVPSLKLRGRAALDPNLSLELELKQLPVGARTVLCIGTTGAPVIFANGRWCVGGPWRRLPVQLATGTLGCDAHVEFDLNRWIRTQPGLTAGTHLAVQAWIQAPGGGVGLSDALDFSVFP